MSANQQTANQANEDDELDWSDEEGTTIDDIFIPAPVQTSEVIRSETRLIITKIRNHFFKSYAEETILGPFCQSFNAVIGPNGSGKSNVIDSILFVFGYRATKIRSKKLSVLLHNSEKYPNVQSCYVAVHFCEIKDISDSKYEVVPGSEICIQRTANKDNSSFYLLNGKRVQFKEIAVLLNQHGIDLRNNRFLILQGEVEEIALMKPKGSNENETGMLEYLEELIGTKRYKKPLFQIEERIEYLTEVRIQKLNNLQLIKTDLEKLVEPMKKAIEFLKEENKVAQCKNFLYQHSIHDFGGKLIEITADYSKISEHLEQIDVQLKEVSDKKVEKDNLYKQQNKKYDTLIKQRDQLKQTYDESDKREVQLFAEMKQLNTNRKKFKEQLADEHKKHEKLRRLPEENAKKIAECEQQAVRFAGERAKLEEERLTLLEQTRKDTQHLQTEKTREEGQLVELKNDVFHAESELNLAIVNLEMSTAGEKNAKAKLVQLQSDLAATEGKHEKRQAEVRELQKTVPGKEKLLQGYKRELEENRREQAQISSEFNAKRFGLVEARNAMASSRSQSRVLDALMELKRIGKLPGLFGRLGDLGTIDKKYDVAISTACGPLDNILVDTVSTAQFCIEHLKAHDIGRATFIALEKQQHLNSACVQPLSAPENVPRLFDLINFQDASHAPAFYFALRDTLVCETLAQASRIAYGARRWRVVTQKGELFELSGTMSGGGRALRGRMGQAFRPNVVDLEALERDVGALRGRVEALQARENELNELIAHLEPELGQMRNHLTLFSREIGYLSEQRQEIAKQVNEQALMVKSTFTNVKQIAHLTEAIKQRRNEFEAAQNRAGKVQAVVDRLSAEIEAKSGKKLRPLDESIAELKSKLDRFKNEINKLNVAITINGRNVEKSEGKMANLTLNITEAEGKLRAQKAERDVIVESAKELLLQIERVSEELEAGRDEFGDLRAEIVELQNGEKELKLKRVDVNATVKIIKAKLDGNHHQIKQLQAKLASLRLQQIPDEEEEELATFTGEEIAGKSREVYELELESAENYLKHTKPNLTILDEYREGKRKLNQRQEEVDVVSEKRTRFKTLKDTLVEQRRNEFLGAFQIIKAKLKEMYQMITLGGDADLDIIDSFDPFNEGIEFCVRPPKKSWKSIMHLSGGEKTLSSLAFVFALHHYKPSPLYVMDEIDAALDFKNVSIVAHYIKERTKNSQFVIISLRDNMFELAEHMIGIYKVENCTQTITVQTRMDDDEDEGQGRQQADKENEVPNVERIEELVTI